MIQLKACICTNAYVFKMDDLTDHEKLMFDSIWKDMDELFNKFGVDSVNEVELQEYWSDLKRPILTTK